MKIIELNKSVTDSNDRDAEVLRNELTEKGICLINLMSSPGSGKTTLLSRIIKDMNAKVPIAVCEADIASAVDAERIESLGATAVQVHTDGMCHMDAGMTRKGLFSMDLGGIKLAFLENVGNLICPAEFDTGAHVGMMILSVPEGQVLVITKMDALPYFTFDLEKCRKRALTLNPNIKIFPVSAKTGEGMEDLENWLGSLIE